MLWPTHPLPESRQCSPCYRTLLPAYKVPLARASPLQSRRGGQGARGQHEQPARAAGSASIHLRSTAATPAPCPLMTPLDRAAAQAKHGSHVGHDGSGAAVEVGRAAGAGGQAAAAAAARHARVHGRRVAADAAVCAMHGRRGAGSRAVGQAGGMRGGPAGGRVPAGGAPQAPRAAPRAVGRPAWLTFVGVGRVEVVADLVHHGGDVPHNGPGVGALRGAGRGTAAARVGARQAEGCGPGLATWHLAAHLDAVPREVALDGASVACGSGEWRRAAAGERAWLSAQQPAAAAGDAEAAATAQRGRACRRAGRPSRQLPAPAAAAVVGLGAAAVGARPSLVPALALTATAHRSRCCRTWSGSSRRARPPRPRRRRCPCRSACGRWCGARSAAGGGRGWGWGVGVGGRGWGWGVGVGGGGGRAWGGPAGAPSQPGRAGRSVSGPALLAGGQHCTRTAKVASSPARCGASGRRGAQRRALTASLRCPAPTLDHPPACCGASGRRRRLAQHSTAQHSTTAHTSSVDRPPLPACCGSSSCQSRPAASPCPRCSPRGRCWARRSTA